MAIEITARIVVSKQELTDSGIPTGDDLGPVVASWLTQRLPEHWDADQLSVGIQRKVKKDKSAETFQADS